LPGGLFARLVAGLFSDLDRRGSRPVPDQRGEAEHDGNDQQKRERYAAHGPPLWWHWD
jgi:hypothetical protein